MRREPQRHRLARLRDTRSSRAYGLWVCRDGREVIFNRDYIPLWQRRDGVVTVADPGEWVSFVAERWFYSEADTKWPAALDRRLNDMMAAFLRGEDVTGWYAEREAVR